MGERLRVLVVAYSRDLRVAVLNDLNRVVRAGGEGLLLTLDRREWEPVRRGIRVLELGPWERRFGVNRLAQAGPGAAGRDLRYAAASAIGVVGARAGLRRSGFQRLRGRADAARRLDPIWATPTARWQRFADRQAYRDIRSWLLWRVTRRRLLDEIDASSLDQLVVAEPAATTVAWHLARRYPGLRVLTRSMDRAAVEAWEADRSG